MIQPKPIDNDTPRFSEDPDTQMLLKSAQDPEFFSCIHRKYFPILARYCMGVVARQGFGWQEAEDLAEEILVKAFVARFQFQGRSKASTWLFSIAHHTCVNFLKGYRLTALEEAPAVSWEQVEQEALQSEFLSTFWSLVNSCLTAEERQTFLLSDGEELTYHQIAEILECSVGKVHALRSSALRKLKAHLVESGLVSL